ncbi:branched-chain amino acid ABC transporter permease [Ornithinicoccus halotolerans]|uniref:branched-chain amino acid ABC transporter permease n=1 Tax=Ornithinicoccus halotolerans TaxID=1748220 RepID=UPI001E561245|nr:branched-chain amino acid ABC transporter permease [Ornithinicoccus halotolerans]
MLARLVGLLAALTIALSWGAVAVAAPGAGPVTGAGDTAPVTTASMLPLQQTEAPDDAEETQQPEEPAELLRGTLRGPDRQPLSGLTITVTRDGEEVGSTVTDDQGQWEVGLPGPGTYAVGYDPAELPEGVVPREEGGEQLQGVVVRPGAAQGVIFQLAGDGEGEGVPGGGSGAGAAGPTLLSKVAQLLVEGIKFGAIIAITSVGLSLVFGTTRLINFAHGEFVTIGAVVAFFASTGGPLPLVLGAVVAIAFAAALAGGLELSVWRPMRRRSTGLIQMFIVAIGLSLVLRHLVLVVFGSRRRQYDEFTLQPAWDLGLVRITPRDLVITVLAFLVMVLVAVMLQRTRTGKAMRAVNDNQDLARASGIDVERVVMVVWLVGGGLAGLGGVLYGLTQAIYPEMGFTLLLLMFAGVILGGIGSAYGAMIGSLAIGVISQLSTLWFPASLQFMWALLAMILVLLFRPQGILGRRERIG